MTKCNLKKLRNRVRAHTIRAMVDCANQGHGSDDKRAFNSEDRLVEFIEGLVDLEVADSQRRLAIGGGPG